MLWSFFKFHYNFDPMNEILKIWCHIYVLIKKFIILWKIYVTIEVFHSTILQWWGGRKHCCSFLLFGSTLIIGGWWVVGHCRKSNIGPAEIASFSSQDFSQSNKEYEITFFIKIHVKVFIFKSDLNGLQKRVFSVEYVKIIKFCVVHKWRYMHFLIKNVFLCHN